MRTTGAGEPPVNRTGGTVEAAAVHDVALAIPSRCRAVRSWTTVPLPSSSGHQARLGTAGAPVHGGGDLRRCAGVVPGPELGDAALDLRPGSRRPEAHAGPGLGW